MLDFNQEIILEENEIINVHSFAEGSIINSDNKSLFIY